MEWLASIDGEPVAHARAFPGPRGLLLDGAATLPQRTRPGRVPRADRRALGRSRRAGHAGTRRAGTGDVATDSRAVRLRGRLHHVRSGTRSAVNDALREFAQNPDRYTLDLERRRPVRRRARLRDPGHDVGRRVGCARRARTTSRRWSRKCASACRRRRRSRGGSIRTRSLPTCTSGCSRSDCASRATAVRCSTRSRASRSLRPGLRR